MTPPTGYQDDAAATAAPGPGDAPRWGDLLIAVRERLASLADARRILEQAGGWGRAGWPGALREPAPAGASLEVDRMVRRRASGEPLQYVLGGWGFRSLDLALDARVLIPRPETEQVVEVALGELDRWAGGEPSAPVQRVADLGTGSGAIALSIAGERRRTLVWAGDASQQALAVARENLGRIGPSAARRVRLVEGSWFAALPGWLRGQLALVVSNPPYVAKSELATLPAEVRDWEPAEALVAGPTGTEALEELVDGCAPWLAPRGALVLELAPHQAKAVAGRCRRRGYGAVRVVPDLAGRVRILVARVQ